MKELIAKIEELKNRHKVLKDTRHLLTIHEYGQIVLEDLKELERLAITEQERMIKDRE